MHDRSSFNKGSTEGMSTLALEMQQIVRSAAEPVSAGETVKGQMRKAWKALGYPSFWRLRAAWYGEAASWSARAADDMRQRAVRVAQQEARGRAKAAELGALYAGIAARLAAGDADFHREQIAGLEHAARALGYLDRPVDEAGEQ